jgi:hypothetical protein
VLDASSDPKIVDAWWKAWPDSNIGIACGAPSGIFVVDIDPRNGGLETWECILDEAGGAAKLATTYTVYTGGGGMHYYFDYTPSMALRSKLGTGIDVQANGKYVVAPPSVHPDGGSYESLGGVIQSPPEWLSELLLPDPVVEKVQKVHDPNDTRPGTLWANNTPWASILEPYGWKWIGSDKGVAYWCRPGKSDGISATTNYEESDLLYVFSSSTPFEPNRGYDKVGALAVLKYGGDVTATLSELKDTYTPSAGLSFEGLFEPVKTAAVTPVATSYSYESVLPATNFISKYIEYGNLQTDAASEYHEAAALILLALATTNLRANLAPYPGGLRTNLYLCLVGTTTRSRKSTSQNICEDLADSLVPYGILPSKSTTEALVNKLAGHSGLASVWLPDELGMNLAEISARTHLQGIEDLLLTLYGGKEYVYAKVADIVTVRNAHLSVLGAATPESLALMGPTAMLGGLLPRFGIVLPPALPLPRSVQSIGSLVKQRKDLLGDLREVMQHADENTEVSFAQSAIEALNKAELELVDTGAHTARLPAMLYKVATLVAAGRLSSEVSELDAKAAIQIVYRWRDGANRLQPYLRRKAADIEFDRVLVSALKVLKDQGGTANRKTVAYELGTTKQKLDTIQATLEDRGYISVDHSVGVWRWVRD